MKAKIIITDTIERNEFELKIELVTNHVRHDEIADEIKAAFDEAYKRLLKATLFKNT